MTIIFILADTEYKTAKYI